jgi:hypothetical protein
VPLMMSSRVTAAPDPLTKIPVKKQAKQKFRLCRADRGQGSAAHLARIGPSQFWHEPSWLSKDRKSRPPALATRWLALRLDEKG